MIGRTGRRPIFHGWKLVGGGAAIQAMHSGLMMQAFGNYAVLLQREFGWSRTLFSAAYAMTRAESGLLGPAQGSKPRDVLVPVDYFDEIESARAAVEE